MKQSEICERCESIVDPIDTAVKVTNRDVDYVYRMRRYECMCGHIFATVGQRKYNDETSEKAYRKAREYSAGWMF